jgi:hypothetical protein
MRTSVPKLCEELSYRAKVLNSRSGETFSRRRVPKRYDDIAHRDLRLAYGFAREESVILDTLVTVILFCSPVALCLHRK